jgi:hypothetical protein
VNVEGDSPRTLDYETPLVPRLRIYVLLSLAPLAAWMVPPTLYVYFLVTPHLTTSGSNRPQVLALTWAWGAVALRGLVGFIRRERTWWSAVYLALFFALPYITAIVTQAWRRY